MITHIIPMVSAATGIIIQEPAFYKRMDQQIRDFKPINRGNRPGRS